MVDPRLLATTLILSSGLLLAHEDPQTPKTSEVSCTCTLCKSKSQQTDPTPQSEQLGLLNKYPEAKQSSPSKKKEEPIKTSQEVSQKDPIPQASPALSQHFQIAFCPSCCQLYVSAVGSDMQHTACASKATPQPVATPPQNHNPCQCEECVPCPPPDPCCSCIPCSPEPECCAEDACCQKYGWNSFFTVDFLYWYARETKLTYAQQFKVVNQQMDSENDASSTFIFAPTTSEHLDTSWDPGVRVGRGWHIDCEGWDFFLVWTYFKNCVNDTVRTSDFSYGTIKEFPGFAQSGLLNPWINPSFSSFIVTNENLPFIFDKVAAEWELIFNSIDLEIGKGYCCTSCFDLRTYAGIRVAWTKTKFETKSTRTFTEQPIGVTNIIFEDQFQNRFWGGGLIGGFQPNWFFTRCYSLFANIEASLIWGKYELEKKERYKENQSSQGAVINYKNSSESDYFQIAAIIDLGIGLRWERTWCCDALRTALDIGWEQHIWFDQNGRYKAGAPFYIRENTSTPTLTGYGELEETCSNLMYGGLTIRLRFDF